MFFGIDLRKVLSQNPHRPSLIPIIEGEISDELIKYEQSMHYGTLECLHDFRGGDLAHFSWL
jgi:hypothetical protein